MTQRARKGKLYQLQVLIDLSCFIISHVPVLGCPHSSTQQNSYTSRTLPTKRTASLSMVVAGSIGTIFVVQIVAQVRPEMGRLKTLTGSSFSPRGDL
jgi:hypothetical protein